MRIQHNIMAMNAYRNYSNNTSALSANLEKLSSGYKINRAGDDAAGLAISEKMRAQITGLDQAGDNVKDGISLVKTAEGALQEVQDMLNRMVELATQSANGTYDDSVDRANLQAEVDALQSEIDRIADSSNFNGINLLDGSLGLNTDAFSISSAAAVKEVTSPLTLTYAADPNGTNTAAAHLGTASVTQVNPEFTIDLTGASATATDAAGTDTTLKVTVAGKQISVKLAKTGGANSDGKYDSEKLAAEIASAYNNDTDNTPANKAVGDFLFTATADGSKITFTLKGVNDGTGTAAANYKAVATTNAANEFTKAQVDTVNAAISSAITFDDSAAKVTLDSQAMHNDTNVKYGVATVKGEKAGIDVTLSTTEVKDGVTLTIDDQTFVFKTTTTGGVEAGDGQTLIDVSGVASANQVQAAIQLLSQQTTENFQIQAKDGTTLHIDQKDDSTKLYDTYAKLKDAVTAKTVTTKAKNAGTAIAVVDSKVQEGNTLSIDGKSYVFTNDTSKTDTADTFYVAITGGAAKNLAAKIGTTAEFDSTKNVVTVRAAKADANAPEVLGKGLTLQIGDTSESYNQLSVSVSDMHSSSIGVGAKQISIATAEDAQAAISVIKTAINTVSSTRGTLGATQNRLEHTANNLSVMSENIQDAESTIRDTDIAEEMMSYTKNNILVQSAQAMLAQANQVPQGVLQLLQ